MVAQLVRLKLTLLANTFRRSVWQTIGIVLGSLYGLTVVVLAVGAAVAGGISDPGATGDVLVLVGSVVVLAWWVVPLFAFGVDATLDPQRFVTYPIPRRQLLGGLAAAGVVSVPGIATALAAVGVAFAFVLSPAALVAAVVGGVLAVAICVVGSRAITTVLSPLLESRRSREVLTVAAFVPIMLIGPVISWFAQRFESTADGASASASGADVVTAFVGDLAGILAWTPLGAPWGLGAAVHDGDWGLAAARLAVAVATLAVVWWVWDRALAKSLVTPQHGGGKGARGKGLGWFGRLGGGPTSAVAARALTYWVRDPRYSASIAIVPLLPVVLYLAGQGSGGVVLLILAPLTAWILGFGISNDIAYDHTAFALHVATGTSGRADRWGRALPVVVAGTPVIVAFAVVSVALSGRWAYLPALLGLSLGVLLVSVGVSSAVSARLLYPVPKPGDSPFKQPQGAALASLVAQTMGGLLTFACSLPMLAMALPAMLVPIPVLGWVSLVVSPVIGVVLLFVGVRWGARTYDRRAPEMLQQVLSYA